MSSSGGPGSISGRGLQFSWTLLDDGGRKDQKWVNWKSKETPV